MNLRGMEEALVALAGCLEVEMDAIQEAGGPGVCLCTVLPGEAVPQDYCSGQGCGGMAWVRLVTLTPNEAMEASRVRCFSPLVATVEMGVLRGVPSLPYQGLPTDEDHLAMSLRQQHDLRAMCRAVAACSENHDFTLGGYTPVGPQGGCVGGAWTLALDVDM